MKISCIYTTARLGGFDLMVNSFLSQTMPRDEFEVVVVDEYYHLRSHLLEIQPLNIKHVPPKRIQLDYYDNSSGWNAGLVHAEGELVTFLVDFCWLYPRFLEDHWDFYQRFPGYSMSGYIDRHVPPPVMTKGNMWWSVFETDFNPNFAERFFAESEPEYRERKGGQRGAEIDGTGFYEMPPNLVYMLNDSIPLWALRTLNGWDEAYDGGYGSNDIDLATRAGMLGWKFVLNPDSIIKKLGTPSSSQILPGIRKPRTRTPEENYRIFTERIARINRGEEQIEVPKGRGAW